jgi:hypothetical protein
MIEHKYFDLLNEKWILNFKDKFNKTKNYISIKSYKALEKFLINILPKS